MLLFSLLELTAGIVFFADQNLTGQTIPNAITKASGRPCYQHRHFFPIEAEDVDWLPYVGQWGWIVITKDWAILETPVEREALLAAGVRAFVFRERRLGGQVMAEILTVAMPKMLHAMRIYRAPFVFSLETDGTITAISQLEQLSPS